MAVAFGRLLPPLRSTSAFRQFSSAASPRAPVALKARRQCFQVMSSRLRQKKRSKKLGRFRRHVALRPARTGFERGGRSADAALPGRRNFAAAPTPFVGNSSAGSGTSYPRRQSGGKADAGCAARKAASDQLPGAPRGRRLGGRQRTHLSMRARRLLARNAPMYDTYRGYKNVAIRWREVCAH
jgi:hypothetical protein